MRRPTSGAYVAPAADVNPRKWLQDLPQNAYFDCWLRVDSTTTTAYVLVSNGGGVSGGGSYKVIASDGPTRVFGVVGPNLCVTGDGSTLPILRWFGWFEEQSSRPPICIFDRSRAPPEG